MADGSTQIMGEMEVISNKYKLWFIQIKGVMYMNESLTTAQKDTGTMIVELIKTLLEDQTGESYECRRIDTQSEETA